MNTIHSKNYIHVECLFSWIAVDDDDYNDDDVGGDDFWNHVGNDVVDDDSNWR
jgi:hypothetical protein